MSNTVIPSQLGYTAPDSSLRSQVFIGKDLGLSFEAVGVGKDGRPDQLQALKIYISEGSERYAAIHIDVEDVKAMFADGLTIPDGENPQVFIKLRTVSVCEVDDKTGEAIEKKMVILGSQAY